MWVEYEDTTRIKHLMNLAYVAEVVLSANRDGKRTRYLYDLLGGKHELPGLAGTDASCLCQPLRERLQAIAHT